MFEKTRALSALQPGSSHVAACDAHDKPSPSSVRALDRSNTQTLRLTPSHGTKKEQVKQEEKRGRYRREVGRDSGQEATRCCAGKICKRGMHSTCWEERGGSPLPLDSHGKSVFWSCADLDAQIRPWKSYCKSLAEFPGVGPSS